ncbi:MAG: DUF3261 domain-containing protein [Candidatus Accumulibacter sp.]|jgi:hypothetical protein|nr:DUF3261 domain-containing protein [Accumulibacter sp.]
MKNGFLALACASFLCACAALAPEREAAWRISPAVLGEHTVEQQLLIRWPGGERSLDAVLEIAGGRLRLVLMSFGLRVMSLEYDGETLAEERYVPHAPDGARMLNDLLAIAAPADELRRALPTGWELAEDPAGRVLAAAGATRLSIRYGGPRGARDPWQGRVTLKNHAEDYELILLSHVSIHARNRATMHGGACAPPAGDDPRKGRFPSEVDV